MHPWVAKGRQFYVKHQALFQAVIAFYQRHKDKEYVYWIALSLLALNKILRHYFWRLSTGQGIPQSEDGQWYINYANALMSNFSIGLHMDDIMYLGYNLLLTLLLAVFKTPEAVVLVQSIAVALGVIIVYKIAGLLFNRLTAVLAGYFYYSTWDTTLWAMYILSDSFFIILLLLVVYFLLMAERTGKRSYQLLFLAAALYMLVFRPTGIVSLGFIAIYTMIGPSRGIWLSFLRKYRWAVGGLAVLGAGAAVFLTVGGKLDPLIASMQFNAKKVLYNIYARGWIFDKPSPYDHPFRPDYKIDWCNSLIVSFLINNWSDILIIYGKRVIAFLGRWVWQTDVSSFRGVVKLAEDLVPTVLFLIGTFAAIRHRLFRKASIVWLLILSGFIFCIIFFIDAMYRYRAPAIPFIAIAAAYGADQLIRLARRMAIHYAGKLRNGTKKNIDRHPGLQ